MLYRLAIAILAAAPLLAQTRGAIQGNILDPSGAAVPKASVRIEAAAIGLERRVTTDDAGEFVVPSLPRGEYTITVEAAGFKTLVRSGVVLDTDQVANLRLPLEVGQISDRVTVDAHAQLVDTSTAEVSRLITGSNLQNYALPGRNPYYMMGILPGIVSRYGNFTTDFRATSYSMGGLMVNGNRKDTNFVTLDGINNGRVRDGVQVNNILGVDFIEEVNVYTSRYAPEFGRSTGGQINFITRRGTQLFHGSAYEFFMSDQFAAYTPIVNTKPRLRYHDYGFTISGPAYIPHKWNADKNKLFWFFGMEGRRQAGFNQKLSLVPTPLERSGDFSQSRTQPVDPSTGAPFPGGVIPGNRISNLGKALQKLYPDPNFPGPGGNYLAIRSQPTDNQDFIFRTDYAISQKTNLTVRGLHGDQNFTSPFDNTGNNIPLFEVYRHRRGNNFAVTVTKTFSPSLINEFSVGESDYREDFTLQGDGYRRDTWGIAFPQLFTGGNNGNRIPAINISGYTGVTGSNQPSKAATPTFVLYDNLTKLVGPHSLKFGFYFENMNMNELNQAADNGSFSFGNSSSNPKNSGVPWANALLGNFDSYIEAGPQTQTVYHAFVREFYAQDSWRARRNLTIEFGMRYSLISPWSSKWNNEVVFMQRFWDPAKAPQVAANGSIVPNTGDPYNGLVLPGSSFEDGASRLPYANDPAIKSMFRGIPEAFNPLRKTNFQPRLSYAWDVFGNSRLVVRSGAGIFQGVTGIAYSGWYLGARAPLVRSATVSNGFADNPGSGIPNTTQFPIDAGALPEDYKIPTMYQYSFGIQSQLPFQTLLDISYVGSSGRHLSFSRPLNYLMPADQQAHQGVDLRPFLPYRGLNGISIVEPSATSEYNSLQVLVKRRARDLTYSFAYTLGKNIGYGIEGIAGGVQNPQNIRAERSELEESRRHNVVVSHTYDTPWFKGQKGFLGRVLGGWSINGVWTWSTGRLYAPGLTGAARQVATRPNVVGEWELPSDQRTPFRYFNTAAFARPADWTYGNAGKWVIRGPGTFDLSAFALKDIKIHERAMLQLRIEAFNAINHWYWTDLNTTLGQGNFGQVGGVSTPRYIQLGTKFQF
jgi:hypothetical protein